MSQHFPPETPPTGRRAQELAESLANRGHEVTVISGRPNHPSSAGRFFCRRAPRCERAPEGYLVLRVPVFRSADARAWKRLLNYATFALAAIVRGVLLRTQDAVLAISPLPAGLAALVIHWRHRAPLVYDLQDIWPESARAVGVMRPGRALRLLGCAERLLYRCSAQVVVISEGFRDYLANLGVRPTRIRVIPNGVDAERFCGALPELRLRRVGPLRGRFVVGYVGNLGLAQGLDTLLEAAACLRREPVAFLLIGEGVEKSRLERNTREAGLDNVHFLAGVPRRRVPRLLAACDALLVILRDDPLFRITIPSKLYEYMAAGKPVLCSVGGEAAALVEAAKCGVAIPPSDGRALAEGVRELRQHQAASEAAGRAGAAWVRAHFSLSKLMGAYGELVEAAVLDAPRGETEHEPLGSEAPMF